VQVLKRTMGHTEDAPEMVLPKKKQSREKTKAYGIPKLQHCTALTKPLAQKVLREIKRAQNR